MDSPALTDDPPRSPRAPDLLTTPEIERELDAWRMTGNPPFPELRLSSQGYWYRFSPVDLRLIHHIAGLSIDLHRRGYSACMVWAEKMPAFLTIALTSDFVMSSILALSAAHLAWMTENSETENLAYHHRGVALKGLHEAIGAFSKENSEAILAASMLLSWQATEWRSWASLQQGVSTVLNAMQPWWKEESDLANYLETQRSIQRSRTPVTPSYPATASELSTEDVFRLDQLFGTLQDLQQRVAHTEEQSARVADLVEFLGRLRNDLPLQSPEEAFERLQTLRAWLFWLPPALLRAGESDLAATAILAHFFAAALAIEPLFPEIGGAYLGTMSVAPIEEMQRILLARKVSQPYDAGIQMALSLMQTPSQIVSAYRNRIRPSVVETYRSASHSPYQQARLQSTVSSDPASFGAYGAFPLGSPANLAVPRSPYHSSGAASLGARRSSQYLEPSPGLQPQLTDDRSMGSMSGFESLSSLPMSYSPAFADEGAMGYDGTAAFTYTGGFVAPELWT